MSLRLVPLSALAALLLLPACAADESAAGGARGGIAAVPAPLPAGSPVVATAADDGGAVTLRPGQTLAVTLVGVPTAGYVWTARAVPPFLAEGSPLSGPTSEAQGQPGFTGGSHWEVLVFEALRPGSGVLTAAQARPWETDEPPVATFTLTVTVE